MTPRGQYVEPIYERNRDGLLEMSITNRNSPDRYQRRL